MRKSILVGIMIVLSVTIFSADIATSPTSIIMNENSMSILSDYVAHAPILITSDNDFETQGWLGNGTSGEPYIIEGLSIDGMGIEICILIANTSAYFVVRNCHLYNGGEPAWTWKFYAAGLSIFNATNGLIEHNRIVDTVGHGIDLLAGANNNIIDSNNCSNNRAGIVLHGSSNNIIKNNTFIGGTFPPEIVVKGIHLSSYSYDGGHTLNYSINNLMVNNYIANNSMNAEEHCLYQIESSHENCTHNHWDDGINTGNFWDDYNGTGVYEIEGTAGTVDHYPRRLDITQPTIDSPDDIEYVEGTMDNVIVWRPAALNPSTYQILQNGTIIISESWNGSIVEINVDGLLQGIYNYSLIVFDTSNNWAFDMIIITVTITPVTTTTTTATTTGTTTITTSTTTTTSDVQYPIVMIFSLVVGICGVIALVVTIIILRKR